MQHTAGILAYILRFPHMWDTVLATQAMALLSDSVLGAQIDVACSLAHITGAERGKHEAATRSPTSKPHQGGCQGGEEHNGVD
jgi:hypothetical protein